MIFAIIEQVVQKHEKSPTVKLWLASRMSVFNVLKKIGLLLTISITYLRSDKIRKVR